MPSPHSFINIISSDNNVYLNSIDNKFNCMFDLEKYKFVFEINYINNKICYD